jgi:hypothetical protein
MDYSGRSNERSQRMASKILRNIVITDYNLEPEIELLNSIIRLPEEYEEFGQGYWKNISLYNASGKGNDSQFRVTEKCFPTEYAEKCPEINRLISENFNLESLKMVRARSLVDGMVIPHRDFVELKKEAFCLRVFIALENNPDAFHSDESGVFQMMAGEVWLLDAGIKHAAVNFSSKSRMSVCLDFIFEKEFNPDDIFIKHFLSPPVRENFHIIRKPLSDFEINEIITSSAKILNRYSFKDLMFALSKLHFIYDIPVACCYDWLISAAELANEQEIIRKANSLRRYLIEDRSIGERYTINNWSA